MLQLKINVLRFSHMSFFQAAFTRQSQIKKSKLRRCKCAKHNNGA